MENKLEGGGPTKQRSMQVSSSTVNDDHRPSEVNASGSVRPVLNYSIQTGEEFALEFMLERTNHKKASDESAFGDQNINNMVSAKGITENLHSSVEGAPTLRKKCFSKIDDRSHCEPPRAALGDGSSRETSHGHACMVSPETSSKVKLFCSFGGKILPRPSDGNFRYVGGDTHIIRVCKDISWQEMLQRMSAIYSQMHTIKYQLPGEDLDSLVSISCDEDLQNMMDECNVIEDGDRSQKLRMFLFSSKDADKMQFGLGTREGDSEVQYVAAVNGMDLVSGRSSDGHVLAKTSANDLEPFLNHNKENSQVTMNRVETEPAKLNVIPLAGALASAVTTSHIPPMYTNLHNHFESNLHSRKDHIGDAAEGDSHSHIGNHTSDNFQNIDCKTLIGQHITERLRNGFRECDAKVPAKEVISNNYGSIQQMNDCNPTVSLENESFPTRQQHIGTANFKEESCSTSASEYTTLMSSKRIMNPEQNSSTLEAGNAGQTHELNDDDHSHTSTEVFAHGFSNYEVDMSDRSYSCLPSHSFQVSHSERIPREQAQLINRLSKSDDSIGAQFLMVNSYLSQDSTCESFDPFYHGAKQPTLSMKQTCPGTLTVEDGLKQIENYREFADAIMEMSHCEAVLNTKSKKPADFAHHHLLRVNECSTCQSMHNSSEAATNQMACNAHDQAKAQTDDLGPAVGLKSKISDLDDSTLMLAYDKKTIIEEGFLHKAPENRPLQSYSPEVENGNTKGQPKEPLNGDSKLDKWKSSTGAVFKSQGAPASGHYDVSWEDKSKRMHSNNAVRDDNVGRPESFTAALPLAESSAFDSEPQKRDILTEINDRFPPGLLSNIFSIVRITEGVSSPLYNGQTTLSMNVQNPEPRSWSYFRNLAQDQFDHNNVSLMDQDHIGYPSPLTMAEEVKMGMGGESMQVENPFLVVGVNLRTSVSDSEEGKLEYEEASGPFIDISDDFDLSNLQSIKNEDLEELKELGSGTFGTVYHGKWRGTDVAIKRIKKSCLTDHSSEQERLILEFWKEAEIPSNLHHPNVLAFYGVVKDGPGNTLATVTEFMVNGSLRQVLLRKDRYLDLRKQLIIAMDTAFGMEYLHSKNIVHFDLKCDNLLVNLSDSSRPICKVCDFGLSKIKRSTLVSGGVRGTLPWMAPELLSSSRVSEKVDVFSFGIVMWEIITGEEPYANMHYGAIIGGIVNNTLRPPVPKSCDPDWKKLMEQCWVADPVQRPSFTEIASHLQLMYATHKGKTPSAK